MAVTKNKYAHQFCKKKFSRFDPTLGSNNSGLKNYRIKNHHIFGIARMTAFIWHIWIGRKDNCCISVVWIHPSKLKIYILKIPHIRERINFSKKRLFCKKSKCKSAKIFLLVRKIFWLIGKLFWKLGKVFFVFFKMVFVEMYVFGQNLMFLWKFPFWSKCTFFV